MNKLVAVCGATGKQGGGVLAALKSLGGFKLRALTRNPESASSQRIAGADVELVKADFEDAASLRAAFKGVDAVFALTDFWVACGGDGDRELQQGKNLVDAAKAEGVPHFVWSSLEDTRPALAGKLPPLDAAGRTVPHFDAKADIEAYLRQQLPGAWTCVYPAVFFENLLPGAGMDPQPQPDGSFLIAQPCKAKMAWNSTADIGATVAAVIAGGPGRFAGRQVGVNGGDLTLEDVAAVFAKVFGKKVAAVTPPGDAWVAMVTGFGVPEPMAKDLAHMFAFYEAVPMQQLRPLAEARALVPGAQSLEQWLQANRAKYAPLFG